MKNNEMVRNTKSPAVLPSYLDEELIQEIRNLVNENSWTKAGVGQDQFARYDPSIRSVDLFPVDLFYNPRIYGIFNHIIEVYNCLSGCFFDISGVGQLDILRYDVGGHYDFHSDSTSGIFPGDRKISCIAQLSDPNDYEGGDFMFLDEEIPQEEKMRRRAKGSIIVFDSRLNHTITPVTSGQRISAIAWGTGRL